MSDIEKVTHRIVENTMSYICPASVCEVPTIIQHAKPKSSCLDYLRTPLLNITLPAHIQNLTHLINNYFKSGTIPRKPEKALITPLLKNTPMDRNTLTT